MVDIVCLGNLTKEIIHFQGRTTSQVGGPVRFLAKALTENNISCGMVSKIGIDCDISILGNINTDGIQIGEETTRIDIYEDGENTQGIVRSYSGKIDFAKIPKDYYNAGLYIVSTILDDVPSDLIQTIKLLNKKVALDLQGYVRVDLKQSLRLLPFVDYLKLNQKELEMVSGNSNTTKSLEFLLKKMGEGIIILTKGSSGVEIYSNNRRESLNTVPIERVQTVGTGDLFFGFLMAKVYNGEEVIRAAEAAQKYVHEELCRRL